MDQDIDRDVVRSLHYGWCPDVRVIDDETPCPYCGYLPARDDEEVA